MGCHEHLISLELGSPVFRDLWVQRSQRFQDLLRFEIQVQRGLDEDRGLGTSVWDPEVLVALVLHLRILDTSESPMFEIQSSWED